MADDEVTGAYLKVAAAAAMIGLSVSAVKRIPPIDLPYTRVAKRGDRRYRHSDVIAYLEARRVDGR
jgi:hypothetical protein